MSKSEQIRRFYEFGPFRVDPAERVLLRDGKPVALSPKLFDTLLVLVESNGHILEKGELLEKVWPNTFVEESNLSSSVSLLRKTLGTDSEGNQYIETVPRRGYRFSSEVEVKDEASELLLVRRTRMSVVTREEEEDEKADLTHRQSDTLAQHSSSNIELRLARDSYESEHKESSLTSILETSASPRQKWGIGFVALLSITALALFAGALLGSRYLSKEQTEPGSVGRFVNFKLERVTTSGGAFSGAISPDGRYLVYSVDHNGQRSLWLKHIKTNSDKEIVPAGSATLSAPTFSPDGNHIYFVRAGNETEANALYRIPVLGGTEKQLLYDIDTPIDFSPDGNRFVFMRGIPARRERLLIVANIDGTGEQIITRHQLEDRFLVGPAWSLNGETIVFPLRGSGNNEAYANLVEIKLSEGTVRQITTQKWSSITSLCWLPDGSGLVVSAAEREPGSNSQIWHVAYPSGSVRRITNDLADYRNLTITADASILLAVQFERATNIWVVPDNNADLASQITQSNHDGNGGLSWTPDDKIVFTSGSSSDHNLWIMNSDGSNKKQLTEELSVDATFQAGPAVSSDGRYIVFVSGANNTTNIWRMDIDGRNRKQLTFGRGEVRPDYTPDNKWVVYSSLDTQPPTVWKVPIDGGDPVQLTDFDSTMISISQKDGHIAYVFTEKRENSPVRRVGVVALDNGSPVKVFDFPFPFRQSICWAPDGQSLMYVGPLLMNIWNQPLNGGPPKQITTFKSDRIFSFAWSPDGKKLAVSRGNRTGDVVMIRDQQLGK